MARDSAEAGDPDTLQGKFPSEIEGEDTGGGGGGGGGTSAPTLVETAKLSEDMTGFARANNGARALRWDNRPIGGSNYGIYKAAATTGPPLQYPFATDSSQTYVTGFSQTATIDTTISLSGGNALAPIWNILLTSPATSTTTTIEFSMGVTGVSPAIMSSYITGTQLHSRNVTKVQMRTGDEFDWIIPGVLNVPGPFYEYFIDTLDYSIGYAGLSNIEGSGRYRIQRHVLPQTSTTFRITGYLGAGVSFGGLNVFGATAARVTDTHITPVTYSV